ncbi:hypothetical protein ALC56_00106, partial [Trachymyrmex septentrionalis]
ICFTTCSFVFLSLSLSFAISKNAAIFAFFFLDRVEKLETCLSRKKLQASQDSCRNRSRSQSESKLQKLLQFDLGFHRVFQWSFIIADVDTFIIGSDFLAHFNLLPDTRHKRLIDGSTFLKISAQLVNKAEYVIKTTAPPPRVKQSQTTLFRKWHRSLKTALMCHGETQWIGTLPVVLLGLRTCFQKDLGTSVTELVYGTTLKINATVDRLKFVYLIIQNSETTPSTASLQLTSSSINIPVQCKPKTYPDPATKRKTVRFKD